MAEKISIRFYLNKQKKAGENYKIYCRVIVNRMKSEFYTGFGVKENAWDDEKRISNDPIINEELSEISSEIYKTRRNLIDNSIPLTALNIVDFYKGKKSTQAHLISYIESHIEFIESKGEHAKVTIGQYKATKKIIEQFQSKILKRRNISLTEVDFKFIQELDKFMVSEYKDPQDRNIERNTINKHHSRFRTILNKAVNEDLILRSPYKKFKLKDKQTRRDFLTEKELSQIEELDLKDQIPLDRARDFFLFSCYTGLRFNDAFTLKMDDVIEDNEGDKFISIIMHKTDEVVEIPLIEEAQHIIDKYWDHPDREVLGFILPRVSNQKINTHLKVLAYFIKTKKKITHHVARHTFATIALNRSIPIEVVQKLLGQKDIKTTMIYAKMQRQTLAKEMKKMGKVR